MHRSKKQGRTNEYRKRVNEYGEKKTKWRKEKRYSKYKWVVFNFQPKSANLSLFFLLFLLPLSSHYGIFFLKLIMPCDPLVTPAVEKVIKPRVQLTGDEEGVPPVVLEPEYSLLTVSAHKRPTELWSWSRRKSDFKKNNWKLRNPWRRWTRNWVR
jgi:hypothetical protein